jgi:hypothetical protein
MTSTLLLICSLNLKKNFSQQNTLYQIIRRAKNVTEQFSMVELDNWQ